MEERQPADEIIKGLTTKADKIRALVHANYDRAEISKSLGIGYQQVRHVLLRSWITSGLRRQVKVHRETVTVGRAPKWRAAASWEVLTNAGFRLLGEWTSDPASVLRLEAKAPRVPCVYAFVVDDLVVYVGLSKSGLHTRFEQYRQRHKCERTSVCINDPIASTLAAAKRVKVLVATPEPSEWNGLPVNTAAGLEAGLIERIGPIWNILEGAMKA
jgi:hypothetical protein